MRHTLIKENQTLMADSSHQIHVHVLDTQKKKGVELLTDHHLEAYDRLLETTSCQTSDLREANLFPPWLWNSEPPLYYTGLLKGSREFAHPVFMSFVDLWKRPPTVSHQCIYNQSESSPYSRQIDKQIPSGCWALQGLSIVIDSVCNLHWLDFKAIWGRSAFD